MELDQQLAHLKAHMDSLSAQGAVLEGSKVTAVDTQTVLQLKREFDQR